MLYTFLPLVFIVIWLFIFLLNFAGNHAENFFSSTLITWLQNQAHFWLLIASILFQQELWRSHLLLYKEVQNELLRLYKYSPEAQYLTSRDYSTESLFLEPTFKSFSSLFLMSWLPQVQEPPTMLAYRTWFANSSSTCRTQDDRKNHKCL